MQYISGSMIAMVIGGVLAALFGFIASISKEEKTPRWLCVCTFVAGLIVIAGGVASGISDAQDAKAIQEKTDSIAQLTATIADLTTENAAMLTGGKNFCYFDPVESSTNEFTWHLVRMGQGTQAPLYDVKCTIIDIHKLRSQPEPGTPSSPSRNALTAATQSFSLGTLNPGETRVFRKTNLGGIQSQAYVIDFQARNGTWKEIICFEFVSGKWTRAVRFEPDHNTRDFIHSDWWLTGEFPSNAIPYK
jgi:hypothetical protein